MLILVLDRTDTVFRNVSIQNSDAGESPKKKNTTSDHLPHLMPRVIPHRNLLFFPESSETQRYFYPLH
jgi:hypothetical protein